MQATGLKPRDAIDGAASAGIGGGTDALVSFTTDRQIAQDIADGTLELRRALRGELTPDMMRAQAVRDGYGAAYDAMQAEYVPEPETVRVDGKPDMLWRASEAAAPRVPSEDNILTNRRRRYERFSAVREEATGTTFPLWFGVNIKAIRDLDPAQVGIVTVNTKPGARGITVNALGEIRSLPSAIASYTVAPVDPTIPLRKAFHQTEARDADGKWTDGGGGTATLEAPGTIQIKGVARPTTNSDGHPIADTPEKLAAFYDWFGDSKAVDLEGRPQVVYHGTYSEGPFNEFAPSTIGSKTDEGWLGRGFYFTTNKKTALHYANRTADFEPISYELSEGEPWVQGVGRSRVGAFYLRLEHPVGLQPIGMRWEKADIIRAAVGVPRVATPKKLTERMMAAGHDGVILDYSTAFQSPQTEYMVLDPAGIKSARVNRGTYDRSSPTITKGAPDATGR